MLTLTSVVSRSHRLEQLQVSLPSPSFPEPGPPSMSMFAFPFSSSEYSKWHWTQLPASSRSLEVLSLSLSLIAHICLPAVVFSSMRKESHWLGLGYVPCTHSCGVLIFKNNYQKSCKKNYKSSQVMIPLVSLLFRNEQQSMSLPQQKPQNPWPSLVQAH